MTLLVIKAISMNLIEFPIGDWSKDGHNQCDFYVIETTKTVAELRDLHFKCKETLGFEIGNIASEYQNDKLSVEIADILLKANIIDQEFYNDILNEDMDNLSSEDIINIWLDTLKYLDNTFEYKIVNRRLPSILDNTETDTRYLDNPGYGVFYD